MGGVDIIFEFADGSEAHSHMCLGTWTQKFSPFMAIHELLDCFQEGMTGTCSDELLCTKVYAMCMIKKCIQYGEHRHDYPIKMTFC